MTNIRNREEANDVFYTPLILAKLLIQHIDISADDTILDPFKGKGAFFEQFPNENQKDWFEIMEGRDFFENRTSYDWMISNPPFSKTKDVLNNSCLYSKKGFAYILPTYQMSYKRIKLAESFGFYLNKIVYFENPKEWKIGFQMAFFIFTKQRSPSIRYQEESNFIQRRLFDE